jgi:outer membrane protein
MIGRHHRVATVTLLLHALVSTAALAQRGGGSEPPAESAEAPAPTASSPAMGTTGAASLRPVGSPAVITLPDALARAAAQSIDLRIARARLDEASAGLTKAYALLLPNLSAGASYTFNYPEVEATFGDPDQLKQQALLFRSIADITDGSAAQNPDPIARRAAAERAEELRKAANQLDNTTLSPIVIQPRHQVDANLTLAMTLFNPRTLSVLPNVYGGIAISEMATEQARSAILYNVAKLYYQLVAASSVVDIATRQVDSAKARLVIAQNRASLGLLTPLALSQAELDVRKAEQQLRAAQNGLRSGKAALGGMLALVDDFSLATPPPQMAIEDQASNADALVARAFDQRLDVRVQREALAIADRTKLDAWLRLAPSLQLVAQGRYTSNVAGLVSVPVTGSVIVQGSWTIFDGGQTLGAMQEADAKIRQEVLRMEQTNQLIEREVRGSIDDLRFKKEAAGTALELAELAKEQANNADRLLAEGAITQTDASDAALGAFAAQVDAARAAFDVEVARLGLAYALGELSLAEGVEANTDEPRVR